MKKPLAFVLALALLLALAACGKADETTALNVTLTTESDTTLSLSSYLRQRKSFNMNSYVDKVMNAVKTRDAGALESMMCLNIKRNEEGLSDKIEELIDAIDGQIAEYDWTQGAEHEEQRSGRRLCQKDSGIEFKTAEGVYLLNITWEVANNFSPNEIGIRSICLSIQTLVEYMGEVYEQYEVLVIISATEGVSDWHD